MEHAHKILKNISPATWEHPADRAAMAALKQLPVLEDVIKTLFGGTSERALRYLFLATAVRTSPTQFERVHRLTAEACSILDTPETPEVYVSQNPNYNAMAVGFRTPFIVIHSSLEDSLTDAELLGVLAHEIGHIMSGHAVYKTILYLLVNLGLQIFYLPIGRAGLISLIMALREWDRKSELSADRAGLLVTQDVDVAYSTLMKLAGGPKTSQMNIDEFVRQAAEYDQGETVLDGVYKLMNLLGQSHPFPVLRLSELKAWVETGAYDKIMEGTYQQRDEHENEDLFKRFKEAADSYRADVKRSEDPLANIVENLNEHMEKAKTQVEDMFKNIFGR
ncbi:MAG: M48 family metallopeptidase [Spirochaeta sp.]